jgi:hypothetical protein
LSTINSTAGSINRKAGSIGKIAGRINNESRHGVLARAAHNMTKRAGSIHKNGRKHQQKQAALVRRAGSINNNKRRVCKKLLQEQQEPFA